MIEAQDPVQLLFQGMEKLAGPQNSVCEDMSAGITGAYSTPSYLLLQGKASGHTCQLMPLIQHFGTKAGGSLGVPGQPGLYSEILSQKQNNNKRSYVVQAGL